MQRLQSSSSEEIIKLALIIELNEYSRAAGVQNISESFDNGSKLESFLWKANFKVERIHNNIERKNNEKFFDIITK